MSSYAPAAAEALRATTSARDRARAEVDRLDAMVDQRALELYRAGASLRVVAEVGGWAGAAGAAKALARARARAEEAASA